MLVLTEQLRRLGPPAELTGFLITCGRTAIPRQVAEAAAVRPIRLNRPTKNQRVDLKPCPIRAS